MGDLDLNRFSQGKASTVCASEFMSAETVRRQIW